MSDGHPPAIVVGLDNITGLQTARILAARGVRVIGLAGNRSHFGAQTNACAHVLTSDVSGEALLDTLGRLASRVPECVLMPCTDAAVETLSRHRDRLPDGYLLPLARDDVVAMLMDKRRFAEYAQRTGLPFPRTEVVSNLAAARAVSDSLSYPCVMKPPLKTQAWLRHTTAKGYRVNSPSDLVAVYERVRHWSPGMLIQEWMEGPETELFSCNAYFDADGRAQVAFVARKLRQWPPEIGTSASGEECRNDEVLAETLGLFESLGFHGLAYLEMKGDARTGRLMIVEPNVGRPTGRSAIAEAGGVELVYTAYCDAAGLPLPPNRTQRYVGAKWLDLRRDLQAAVVAHRNGRLTARDWLRSLRGPKAHAIWSPRDPKPFITDVTRAAAEGVRMGIGRLAGIKRSQRAT